MGTPAEWVSLSQVYFVLDLTQHAVAEAHARSPRQNACLSHELQQHVEENKWFSYQLVEFYSSQSAVYA